VQEEHGSGRRLIRLRYRLRPTWLGWVTLVAVAATLAMAAVVRPVEAAVLAVAAVVAILWVAGRGGRLATRIRDAFDRQARGLGLVPCDESPRPDAS